MIQTLDRLEKW